MSELETLCNYVIKCVGRKTLNPNPKRTTALLFRNQVLKMLLEHNVYDDVYDVMEAVNKEVLRIAQYSAPGTLAVKMELVTTDIGFAPEAIEAMSLGVLEDAGTCHNLPVFKRGRETTPGSYRPDKKNIIHERQTTPGPRSRKEAPRTSSTKIGWAILLGYPILILPKKMEKDTTGGRQQRRR